MDFTSMLFPLLILLLFIPIFLSSRRQKRAMKETQALQASIEAGDVVMTTSGLRATVVDASYEDTIDLEIADGIVTTWVRAAVREKVKDVADDAVALESPADDVSDDATPELPEVADVRQPAALPAEADLSTNDAVAGDALVDGTAAPSLVKDDHANGAARS